MLVPQSTNTGNVSLLWNPGRRIGFLFGVARSGSKSAATVQIQGREIKLLLSSFFYQASFRSESRISVSNLTSSEGSGSSAFSIHRLATLIARKMTKARMMKSRVF